MPRECTYFEAIREATDQKMQEDPSVYLIGLGVPDPKGIFGTTSGLQEKYGPSRVMDMPTSENAMTGVAIGSSLLGMRPIMTHQRVDFFLLAMDQLINNAAKWHYMFGGQMKAPIVIRLIIGRGWGQGPQHSQSLHSFFAHIPGLKVVMPATPYDAKGLLMASVEDDNPVLFLEHRWLHGTFGEVPEERYTVPLGVSRKVREGEDVTIVACSHMVTESLKAAQWLEKEDISVDLIDMRTIKPLDIHAILRSIQKTKRLIIADPGWKNVGISAEILALVAEKAHGVLAEPPVRIAYPDRFTPTSWALANHFYPTAKDIVSEVFRMRGQKAKASEWVREMLQTMTTPQDVPDPEFKGPF